MRFVNAMLFLLGISTTVWSAPPYEENADARATIQRGMADAERAEKPLMIVFGANWCSDSMALDHAIRRGSAAPLIAENFRFVQVDVGHRDRNVDLAAAYGVPLNKGIPAIAIVNREGKLAYSSRSGELANAEKMGDYNLYVYFSRLLGQEPAPPRAPMNVVSPTPMPQPTAGNVVQRTVPMQNYRPAPQPRRVLQPNRGRIFGPRR